MRPCADAVYKFNLLGLLAYLAFTIFLFAFFLDNDIEIRCMQTFVFIKRKTWFYQYQGNDRLLRPGGRRFSENCGITILYPTPLPPKRNFYIKIVPLSFSNNRFSNASPPPQITRSSLLPSLDTNFITKLWDTGG